jgi:hypothetical protein
MVSDDELREQAIKRLKDRRGFFVHLTVYVIVNAALFALWAMSGGGYYWPMWTAFGWGIGVAFHGLAVLFPEKEPTAAAVDREIARLRGAGMSGPSPTA